MSKRSFLRKSAVSLAATLGLGGTAAFGQITLSGGTLQIGMRNIEATGALRGAYYDPAANPPSASFNSVADIRALEQQYRDVDFAPFMESDLKVNLDFDQDRAGWGGNPFFGLTVPPDLVNFFTNDSIAAVWSGEIVVDAKAAGTYRFDSASDDGSVGFIDGKLVLNNNFFQGRTRRNFTTNLSEGVHTILMAWYEGGGGANGTFWLYPEGTDQKIVNPASPPAGITFRKVSFTTDASKNNQNVTVTANSGINIEQETAVPFGTLTLGNNTLTFNGITTASFTGTTVGNSPTFNIASGRLQTGPLSTGGAQATINKTGGGELVLDQPSPGVPAGSTFNVQAGTLSVSGAGGAGLGAAGVTLAGGTLSLDVGAGAPVNNAITVTANSGLNAVSGGTTVNSVTINPGFTLNTTGSALTLTGVTASGAGTVTISPTNVTSVVNLNDGGNAVTFAKGGAGQLVLTRAGGPGFGSTSKLDVQAGRLVATNDSTGNTLGGAPVTLSGGTLELRAAESLAPGARSIAIKFGADQPDGPGGDDGNSQVNGPAGVFNTANWNNFGAAMEAAPQALNMDTSGTVSASGASVAWNSNNLWSSTGQGEENNTAPAGENRDLMAGYLDTGGVGGTGVTIDVTGLPASFTGPGGYDVYVYIKGGINGRGGDYTIGGTTKFNISDAPFNGTFVEDNIEPGATPGSNYLVFRDLTTADFTLTTTPLIGSPARAPVNAIEIIRATALPPPNFGSNVNATQNSTIDVTGSSSAELGNVSADAGKTLTITGNRLKVNDVSAGAGGVVLFNSAQGGEVAGAIGGAGSVAVGTATLEFTASKATSTGTGTLDIRTPSFLGGSPSTMRFAPGAGNTHAAAGITAIRNEGVLHAANGIVDLRSATMTTAAAAPTRAGLIEITLSGGFNTGPVPAPADFNAATFKLELTSANTRDTAANRVFPGNSTQVYMGEILIGDPDGDGQAGPIAFGEHFDDGVLVKIDGQTLLNNGAWNVQTDSGEFELAAGKGPGWYPFEARLGRGGGPNGQQAPWDDFGIGIDTAAPFNPRGSVQDTAAGGEAEANEAAYVKPVDNGSMNLFRFRAPSFGIVQVDSGSTLKLGAIQGASAVNLAATSRLELHGPAGSKISASALSFPGTPAAPTATLDVTDAPLALDFPEGGPNPAADVRSRIVAARGNTELLGTWTGPGITSSLATADPGSVSVGFAVNADLPLGPVTTFGGQPVDPTTVLVRGTRNADANLDGVVGDDDVTIVGATFGMTTGATWALGDFTYDGAVNDDDVTLLGALYDPSAPPLGGAPAVSLSNGVAAVPEPASWLMMALGGLGAGLFGWRRRRV